MEWWGILSNSVGWIHRSCVENKLALVILFKIKTPRIIAEASARLHYAYFCSNFRPGWRVKIQFQIRFTWENLNTKARKLSMITKQNYFIDYEMRIRVRCGGTISFNLKWWLRQSNDTSTGSCITVLRQPFLRSIKRNLFNFSILYKLPYCGDSTSISKPTVWS